MKITKIEIENFKKFQSLTISLGTTNILVGDNNSGKSTILQAINLALTGYYDGEPVLKNLSQNLFNNTARKKYLSSLAPNKEREQPPSIKISIYLDDFPDGNGDGGEKGKNADGFSFILEFDSDNFQTEYDEMVSNEEIKDLPIEFYRAKWIPFSNNESQFSLRKVHLKSLMIDSMGFQTNDFFEKRLIKFYFDEKSIIKITQKQRDVYDSFKNDATILKANETIQSDEILKNKKISFDSADVSRNSWSDLLDISIGENPLEYAGAGEQCEIKTLLSLSRPTNEESLVALIEEPESHLSYSRLNSLLDEIQKKAVDKQIIITTHSSFVANKMNLQNLILLGQDGAQPTTMTALNKETADFFEKKAGYDTLRLLLSQKVILVEGDSDELVVQKAYLDNYGKLPIQNGVDVISVGTSFLRFLEISKALCLKVSVITDNDGDINALKDKYKDYLGLPNIQICYGAKVWSEKEVDYASNNPEVKININTLEAEYLRSNGLASLNAILGKNFSTNFELLKYMENNKTEWAYAVFKSKEKTTIPEYIKKAL